MGDSSTLVFFVNGVKVEDEEVDPATTLLTYIRSKLSLTGTKLACGEGGCGACTVMVSKLNRKDNTIKHFSLNACLAPVATLHGLAVTTVEGIGSMRTKLHPVQERISRSHGSQCGFCTPGMVMSMYTLLRNNPIPSMADINQYLTGNLCRCTGYRPILESYRTFTLPTEGGCGRTNCCQIRTNNHDEKVNGESKGIQKNNSNVHLRSYITDVLYDPLHFSSYDPSQDVIFPPELKVMKELDNQDLEFTSPRVSFYRPTSLRKLLCLKKQFPHAKIIVGNTEVGIEVTLKNQYYPTLIYPSQVQELNAITYEENGLLIGASVTLAELEHVIKKQIDDLPEYKTRTLRGIDEMLKWFAGTQIRNVAAVGGNIMTGSPISDLNPILMAAEAVLTLKTVDSERKIKMDDKFYTKYRENAALPEEVLMNVYIPYNKQNEYFAAYKQSRRRDDDIAIVNCAFHVKMKSNTAVVDRAIIAYGGMAPTTILAKSTMKFMSGKMWNEQLFHEACTALLDDLPLPSSAPGGMINYRRALSLSFFFKYYLTVKDCLSQDLHDLSYSLSEEEKPVITSYERPPISSTQLFQKVNDKQDLLDPLGCPMPHMSSDQHATGEAVFLDDIPRYHNELSAAYVLTTKARAKIMSVDYSEALKIPGVHSIISAKDIPDHRNKWGIKQKDERIFVTEEVNSIGERVAMVLADTRDVAKFATNHVKVTYEDVRTPIVTIQDAIKAESYYGELKLKKGDPETCFKSCRHTLEGEIRVGGQEHFYMETQSQLAIPHENQEMVIIGSSQDLTSTQFAISDALGVPAHKIVCKTKRLGGGFGGKETEPIPITLSIAVAAAKVQRPVRIVLDRDIDMAMTGKRHPYLVRWKVGFDKRGIIEAVDVELYSNAGCSLDLSMPVLEKSVLSVENGYNIENISITGRACRTNLPSNTAFRAFGAPQAMIAMEDVVDNIATYLHMSPTKIRELNLLRDGCSTPFHQVLQDCTLPQCWDQALSQAKYHQLQEEVDTFNKSHRYQKRGIAVTPVKFGICFELPKQNQGMALLHVYTDGSVLITHGGVEMGQGLHTKMIQIASHALDIPSTEIHIAETSTDKVPNTTPTAASVSSDIYGEAVLNACNKINDRLEPIKKSLPGATWEEVILKAYEERIPLSSIGHHKIEGIVPVDYSTSRGHPFSYFSYGASVSVVQIDCLTGYHTVLQTSIVMDVGTSLNPAIDIGQIEGAFMQGYGLFTLEQLYYSPEGALLTKGPGAYKIPGIQDIPCKFNVSLLRDSVNVKAIYSSKAIGEPPLFLAASAFFAIKDAIRAARKDEDLSGMFTLDSPATAERIRLACQDQITRKLKTEDSNDSKPWAVVV